MCKTIFFLQTTLICKFTKWYHTSYPNHFCKSFKVKHCVLSNNNVMNLVILPTPQGHTLHTSSSGIKCTYIQRKYAWLIWKFSLQNLPALLKALMSWIYKQLKTLMSCMLEHTFWLERHCTLSNISINKKNIKKHWHTHYQWFFFSDVKIKLCRTAPENHNFKVLQRSEKKK